MIMPYKNKLIIDYEISYFGFDFDRKSTKILNCVSLLRGCFSVKMERFQIKQNIPNLKWTLVGFFDNVIFLAWPTPIQRAQNILL